MFGVSCHGRAQTEVIGIRPLHSNCQRTCQWPKLGKLTTARRPMRSIWRNTSAGCSTACKVRDSTTQSNAPSGYCDRSLSASPCITGRPCATARVTSAMSISMPRASQPRVRYR